MWTCTLLLLALWMPGVSTYGAYKSQIPNGDHVPHPCKPNFIWHGVGHKNANGGGDRNPFGVNFAGNGHQWNMTLCQMDSDGDGLTNGQELGDPDCKWTPGQTPDRTTGITHPGVCDPWDGEKCKNHTTFVDCSGDEFTCQHIHDPDVRNITVRFPRTKVPAKETSYVCFNFVLPDDQEYHLIATKPLINNSNVMHHMVLSSCQDSVDLLSEPQDCMMGSQGCDATLSIWTLGMAGECFNPQAGFRIGKGATRVVSLQHHWTNPTEVDTWYDSSGLILYYTPKLRPYNAAVLTIGQIHLTIPPRMPSVVHTGTCTSDCSRKLMKGPVQIVSALNHMHYLGIRQNVTLAQPGRAPLTITDDNPYSYDSPHIYTFDNPITMNPGDVLTTHCTYQSQSRAKTTVYGAGSFEEMCFGFVIYFPAENISSTNCLQWKDIEFCNAEHTCNFATLFNSSSPTTAAMLDKIFDNCDPAGQCYAECPAAIEQVRQEYPCIKDRWEFVANFFSTMDDPKLLKFVNAMKSCDQTNQCKMTTPTTPTQAPGQTMPPMQREPGYWFLSLIKQLGTRPLVQNIAMNVNYNSVYKADDDKHDHILH